jgi:hypothetical protein
VQTVAFGPNEASCFEGIGFEFTVKYLKMLIEVCHEILQSFLTAAFKLQA